jgi:hypothetical protein
MTQTDRRKFLEGAGVLSASAATAKGVLAKAYPSGKTAQSESPCPEKPKPIITGISQAEGIAKFAGRMTYEDLTAERRERLKSSVLETLLVRHQLSRAWRMQNSSAVRMLGAL